MAIGLWSQQRRQLAAGLVLLALAFLSNIVVVATVEPRF